MILYIDLINQCNLHCKTCVRGQGSMPASSDRMSLELCKKIITKGAAEGIGAVGFFNWSDPGLVPNIDEYVRLVKERQLACSLSTNLSHQDIRPLQRAMTSGLDLLMVSVSGYDQKTYEINHVGGNIELIKRNLLLLDEYKKEFKAQTQINLRFIQFQYNRKDLRTFQEFISKTHIRLELIPGNGNPLSKKRRNFYFDDAFWKKLKNVPTLLEVGRAIIDCAFPFSRKNKACAMLFDHIVIDAHGDVFLCCTKPNVPALRIGSYLELSPRQLFLKRYTHPICKKWYCRSEKTLNEEEKIFFKESVQRNRVIS